MLARIFQVVDIYDALTHARPYKQAMTREQVVEIIAAEAERGWRDPEVTAVFLDIVRNRPHTLDVPQTAHDDLGLGLFSEIQRTGALDWDLRAAP